MLLTRGSVHVTHPRDPVLVDWFGGSSNTKSGIAVTAETAKRFVTVATCVRVLAEAIASLPIFVYRRMENGGKQVDANHPLYSLLHDQPNRWQTSVEFVEMLVQHMLLRGNFYALQVSNGMAAVSELIPLHPDRVRPFRAPDGSVAYQYTPENGAPVTYLQDEILHVRDMSEDGLVGLSRISASAEAIGLGMAMEQFGAAFFGNGASAGTILEHPAKLSPEAYQRLKQSWEARHQGSANAHKPAILEEGLKLTQLGIKPDEAQFLESRRLSKEDICGIFRVPPHLVGALDRATNNNIEHQGIDFVVHTLRPILVRIEKAMRRDLLTSKSKKSHFIEFKVDALLRGDFKSRQEGLRIQRDAGIISANEWRSLENMNAQEGEQGDQYLVPLNMIPADKIGEDVDEPLEDDALRIRVARAHRALVRSAFDRIVTCEVKALRNAVNGAKDALEVEQRAAKFIGGHEVFVLRHLQPVVDSLADTMTACGADAERVGASLMGALRALARDHIKQLATDCRAALLEGGAEAVERLCTEWESDRVGPLAEAALDMLTAKAAGEL